MSEGLKVFILGSERSGTSITYYAMREVFGLPGKGESHVFPIYQRMLHQFYLYRTAFKDRTGTLASVLDTRSLRESLLDHLRKFYASYYNGGSWVDKTPGAEALYGIALIREAFPDARFIITRRNGIEVVQSFREKFSAPFDRACEHWARCAEATRKVMAEQADILVVDQFDMTNAAEATARRIADYLRAPEKSNTLARFFTEQRTDQLSSHDWTKRLTLAEVRWSDEEKQTFKRIAANQMQEDGNSMA